MARTLRRNQQKKAEREALEFKNTSPFVPIQHILQGINKRSKIQADSGNYSKKFNDLYSLLSNENLLIQAYGNIPRNKGSLTPGIHSETVDEMSLGKIRTIASKLKGNTYNFQKLRRKWIKKQKK